MTKENRLTSILAALQAAENENAANGYNSNIREIIRVLQPVADDLKSEIAHAAVKSIKPGFSGIANLIEKVIDGSMNNPGLKGRATANGFDYVCDGYILIKSPADKFKYSKDTENPNAGVSLERISTASWIDRSEEREKMPAAAALKSAIKIAKSNYGAKQIKLNGGLVYRLDGGLSFNAEKLLDVLTALEGIDKNYTVAAYKQERINPRMFTADDINIMLMPVMNRAGISAAGLYMGDTKIDL